MFDICIHREMVYTVNLVNISITSHSNHFSVCGEHLRCTLGKFQVYNTVLLSIATIL